MAFLYQEDRIFIWKWPPRAHLISDMSYRKILQSCKLMKFIRHIISTVVEILTIFQLLEKKTLNTVLMTSRLCKILRKDLLWDIEMAPGFPTKHRMGLMNDDNDMNMRTEDDVYLVPRPLPKPLFCPPPPGPPRPPPRPPRPPPKAPGNRKKQKYWNDCVTLGNIMRSRLYHM